MKPYEIYKDYVNVYKALRGDEVALSSLESKYGRKYNMSNLHTLGVVLYRYLSEEEKNMAFTRAALILSLTHDTNTENQN